MIAIGNPVRAGHRHFQGVETFVFVDMVTAITSGVDCSLQWLLFNLFLALAE